MTNTYMNSVTVRIEYNDEFKRNSKKAFLTFFKIFYQIKGNSWGMLYPGDE